MRMQRLLAWILSGALLLSLFLPALVLLSRAAEYADWARTHNRERYRGTALSAAERRLYTAVDGDLPVSARTLARELTAGLSDDTARLAAIYNWVCDNVAYDYDYFEGRSDTTGETAGEVLALGRGVCVGYAELSAQLCRVMGIPCKTVNGYQLSGGEVWGEEHKELKPWAANHVWNEAYVDGRWVIFDTTWGSANTYRDGVTTTGPTSPAQLDVTPETLADTRLNIDYISDGTFTYDQAVDGSLTLTEPLDGALTQADIPATVSGRPVVAVGDRAFEDCAGLTRVTLPKSVTTLGDMAFSYTGLTALPDLQYVTAPGGSLFAYCASLTAATLPAHWTEIPRGIFNKCTNLESVTLPPVITAVGAQAFSECGKLDSFPFENGLKTIGKEAFAGTALTTAHLPNSVTTLGDGAFLYCKELAEVTLPAYLPIIPNRLFADCGNLQEVIIPETVTTIGREAFRNCVALTGIVLPKDLTLIREYTFAGCTELQTVNIPQWVTAIAEGAFEGCRALQSVDLALPTLKQIYQKAFWGCASLKTVHIPGNVQHIGDEAFAYCTSLEAFTLSEQNTHFALRDGALYALGVPYTLLAYPASHPGTTFTVSADVQRVAHAAFTNSRFLQEVWVNLVEPVDVMLDYTVWGDGLFCGSTALRAVHFAEGNRSLPIGSFQNCTALEQVTLPDTLRSLTLSDFNGCTKLKELNLPASAYLGDSAFGGRIDLPALERINVHKDNEQFYDVDGVLFRRFVDESYLILYPAGRPAESYAVPEDTASIYFRAFANSKNLTTVTFPESLQVIYDGAFSGCESLTNVTLPAGLQGIGGQAFEYTNLSEIHLPGLIDVAWAFHQTPWWDAQPDGPVYLEDMLYAIKWPDDQDFVADEIVVQEGTRGIQSSFLSMCGRVKRLVVPASVTFMSATPTGGNPVIVGQRGTAAEEYAKERDYTFVDLAGMRLGDVDGDGKITTTDARLTLQYAVQKIGESDLFLSVADVDGDGAYTTTDARLMLQYAVGKIDSFPAPKT